MLGVFVDDDDKTAPSTACNFSNHALFGRCCGLEDDDDDDIDDDANDDKRNRL